MKILITGAGLSGATAARLLKDAGHHVMVLDKRPHLGGNCFDRKQGGVTVHQYGPHVFHTNNERVWRFLSRHTDWNSYEHQVVADTAMGRIPIPWSKASSEIIGRDLTDGEIQELIFRDYSEKQWGIPFELLPPAIRNRVPTRRNNHDLRYFTDKYQGQPVNGYTAMFEQLLDGIPVELGVKDSLYREILASADLHIYTGKLDAFYHCSLGQLQYRSLKFEHRVSESHLPHASINQCNKMPFTRIYDHSYFLGEKGATTVITKEYPAMHDDSNEPFYPITFGDNVALAAAYRERARAEPRTIFIGRLATFSYLDMWMAVAQCISSLRHLLCHRDQNELLKLPA